MLKEKLEILIELLQSLSTFHKKMILAVGVLCFLLILLLLMIMPDNEVVKKENSLDHAGPEFDAMSRYHLFPPEVLTKEENAKYVVRPEKIDPLENERDFKEDMLSTKIFNKEEENIQIELNKLPY